MKAKLHRRLTKPWSRAVRQPGAGPSDAAGIEAVERFVAEVADRGHFTHRWALGDMPRWETLFGELEQRPARLLEIGSFEGLSTCYFLWRLPQAVVTSVDTFAGSQEHQSEAVDTSELEAIFGANVALVDATRVRKLVGDSKRVLLDLIEEGASFDLVYVDGSHLGLDVLVDAALSWRVVEQGGFLIFDDYPWAKLGEDPLLRPGPAVDAFRTLVDTRHELVFADYQLALRKIG